VRAVIITGTDTGVGKTVLAAALLAATGGTYWKPVQAGPERDTEVVRRLTGLPDAHFWPEAYVLPEPLCPSIAARHAGVALTRPEVPEVARAPLIIEGAGGALVPVNGREVMADWFAAWSTEVGGAPVIVAARTALGTINHTLLTLEALRARGVGVLGVVCIGPDAPETVAEIERFGRAPILGRLPHLEPLTPAELHCKFKKMCLPLLKALA
jgi:dethiobiotin synthetase